MKFSLDLFQIIQNTQFEIFLKTGTYLKQLSKNTFQMIHFKLTENGCGEFGFKLTKPKPQDI